MLNERLNHQITEIGTLMRERLRIRGKTLSVQLRKAGRMLPKAVRRDVALLLEARTQVQSPKLARLIDQDRLDAAHKNVITHLSAIDPAERRKDRILAVLGVLALNLILFGIAFVTWLVWTDRV